MTYATFDETYRAAYSHGLEAIYALETVDPKSIRTLGSPEKSAIETPIQEFITLEEPLKELDLGLFFRGWMTPFLLEEPISVIGITKHAEKCLEEHGKYVLGDLIGKDLSSFVYFKGMGQGHLDEIRFKLERYLAGKPIKNAWKIDFSSWIRSLTCGLDKKKCYVLLENYQLEELVCLSQQENSEIKRLTLEMKKEWIAEILPLFKKKAEVFLLKRFEAVEVFIKPWVEARLGIATQEEVLERLLEVSVQPEKTESALAFFSFVFHEDFFQLLSDDSELFFSSNEAKKSYQEVIDRAKSYFYTPFTFYSLKQLMIWIEKELARQWIFFSSKFIEKSLRLSPEFYVRKERNLGLTIRLN